MVYKERIQLASNSETFYLTWEATIEPMYHHHHHLKDTEH